MHDHTRAVDVIHHARQTKHFLALTTAELTYVSSTNNLNETEKLLWINFAEMTKLDPHLSTCTTRKVLAKRLGKSESSITRYIRTLLNQGYLHVDYDELYHVNTYALSLPLDALEHIQNAPDRAKTKAKIPVDKVQEGVANMSTPLGKSAHPPEQICSPIPYIINRDNNKHNMLGIVDKVADSSDETFSATDGQEDGYALLLELENFTNQLRKDNPNITFKELSAKQNERFTTEQMDLIFDAKRNQASIEAQMASREHQRPSESVKTQNAYIDHVNTNARLGACESLQIYKHEGDIFKLEKGVLRRLISKLPWFKNTQEFKGEAAQKDRSLLLKEMLYYVANAKQGTCTQLHKFNRAIHLMKKGDWQVPYAIANQQIKSREQTWQKQKQVEIDRSRTSLQSLGLAH